jgi:hypothetical protein
MALQLTWFGGDDCVIGVDSCFVRDFAVGMLRSGGKGLHLHEEVTHRVLLNVCGKCYLFWLDGRGGCGLAGGFLA